MWVTSVVHRLTRGGQKTDRFTVLPTQPVVRDSLPSAPYWSNWYYIERLTVYILTNNGLYTVFSCRACISVAFLSSFHTQAKYTLTELCPKSYIDHINFGTMLRNYIKSHKFSIHFHILSSGLVWNFATFICSNVSVQLL